MEFPHSESPPRRSSHEQVHIHISCLEALEGASKAGTLPDKGGPIGDLERVEVVVQRVKVLPILRIRDEWSRNVAIDRVNSVRYVGWMQPYDSLHSCESTSSGLPGKLGACNPSTLLLCDQGRCLGILIDVGICDLLDLHVPSIDIL